MTFFARACGLVDVAALLTALVAGLGAGTARAVEDPGTPRTVSSFAEVRTAVLEAVAGAQRRIWIVTDYLTDGEIVSALYVAQYRKLDVQVLLGRAKANHYMSRLSYLKNQNIPVYLRPETFKPAQPTGVLTDARLLWVDGDLDFLTRVRKFGLTVATSQDRESFEKAYAEAAGLKVQAIAAPVPLVGRGNSKGVPQAYSGPRPDPQLSSSSGAAGGGGGTDAYYYNKANAPRPDGVPAKLPKGLKWDKPKPPKPAPPKTTESGEASEAQVAPKSGDTAGSSPSPSSSSAPSSNGSPELKSEPVNGG
jgi:hypothetical protein